MNLFFKDDPVFSLLQDVLQANVLKVPDERIEPLGVIEKTLLGKPKFRTTLGTILKHASAIDIDPDYLASKRMANISGEKTNKTNLKLGLEILDGFLKGFGVSLPNLHVHFKDVAKVSFSFENVNRLWMDNGILALELENQFITKNAMTSGFFNFPASKLLLIDSIITSNDFSIHVEETINDQFGFDIAAINEELGSAEGKLKALQTDRRSLTLKGEKPLPFAFTCIQLKLNDAGAIIGMPNYTTSLPLVMGSSNEKIFEKEVLVEKGEFVEIDF